MSFSPPSTYTSQIFSNKLQEVVAQAQELHPGLQHNWTAPDLSKGPHLQARQGLLVSHPLPSFTKILNSLWRSNFSDRSNLLACSRTAMGPHLPRWSLDQYSRPTLHLLELMLLPCWTWRLCTSDLHCKYATYGLQRRKSLRSQIQFPLHQEVLSEKDEKRWLTCFG